MPIFYPPQPIASQPGQGQERFFSPGVPGPPPPPQPPWVSPSLHVVVQNWAASAWTLRVLPGSGGSADTPPQPYRVPWLDQVVSSWQPIPGTFQQQPNRVLTSGQAAPIGQVGVSGPWLWTVLRSWQLEAPTWAVYQTGARFQIGAAVAPTTPQPYRLPWLDALTRAWEVKWILGFVEAGAGEFSDNPPQPWRRPWLDTITRAWQTADPPNWTVYQTNSRQQITSLPFPHGPLVFVGTGPITWVTGGIQLARGQVDFSGNYIGVQISGTSLPYQITALALEVDPLGEWTFSP